MKTSIGYVGIVGFLVGSVGLLDGGVLDRWEWRSPLPTGLDLEHVAHGNDTFVAVGSLGAIVISTNGIDWTAVHSGITGNFRTIAFGNGTFAATAGGLLFTSSNGTAWAQRSVGTNTSAGQVAYGNGYFLLNASRFPSTNLVMISTDGIAWTSHALGGISQF